MKIYISIPMSGHDLAKQEAKAAEIAELIRQQGHEPVNPFDTPPPPDKLPDKELYAYYMGEDIKRLLVCDAILMCDGSLSSRGCNVERCAAEINGLQVFYTQRAYRRYCRMRR